MHNNRKTITAGELYVMLDREFRSRQSKDCGNCYILLPYRVDHDNENDNANWEVILPPECAYGCIRIVESLVDEYSQIYDLALDDGRDD
jgi:hypothetical protein